MREVTLTVGRYPGFVLLWLGRFSSVIAFNMLVVAVGWAVYDLTNDPLDLGLVGLVQFLPILLLTLAVGQVADRYDRRLIVAVCRATQGVAGGLLALGSAAGWLDTTSIFALVALIGAARAFEDPTVVALMTGLVPREIFARATVWYTMSSQLARITGPAFGGFLYLLGPTAAFSVAAAVFAVAAILTLLIPRDASTRASAPVSLESVFAGLVFTWRTPIILGSISLDLFVVLLGGATALLPIYARDILETGPVGLGLLRSAPAVGAIAMSAVLAKYPIGRNVGTLLFAAVIVFGLATVIFGVSTSLPLSLVALAVLGAANMVSVVIRISVVQLRTPNEMRGRVSAVNSLFTGTSNQLGDFESGLTAAWFGVVPAVLIGGIGTVLVALTWMRLFPDLRRVERFDA
ncbi:MAG: MFS transporter [Chloroflexi bacterium]|nr:MFS transporter [Chloroflexota bacterium]